MCEFFNRINLGKVLINFIFIQFVRSLSHFNNLKKNLNKISNYSAYTPPFNLGLKAASNLITIINIRDDVRKLNK